jgi:hypothetical protein
MSEGDPVSPEVGECEGLSHGQVELMVFRSGFVVVLMLVFVIAVLVGSLGVAGRIRDSHGTCERGAHGSEYKECDNGGSRYRALFHRTAGVRGGYQTSILNEATCSFNGLEGAGMKKSPFGTINLNNRLGRVKGAVRFNRIRSGPQV